MNDELYLNSEEDIFEPGNLVFQFFAGDGHLQVFEQTILCHIFTVVNIAATAKVATSLSSFVLVTDLVTTATS